MSEVKTAEGKASAFDAKIIVENNVGALEKALSEAQLRDARERPHRRVIGAEDKVARAKRDLVQAEEELEAARADLDRAVQEGNI